MKSRTDTTDTTETTEITGELLSIGLGRPEVAGFEAASALALASQIDDFITANPTIDVAEVKYATSSFGQDGTWHSALVLYHHGTGDSEASS